MNNPTESRPDARSGDRRGRPAHASSFTAALGLALATALTLIAAPSARAMTLVPSWSPDRLADAPQAGLLEDLIDDLFGPADDEPDPDPEPDPTPDPEDPEEW